DLYKAGGVPVMLQRLQEAGLLNEDTITVTGRTIGELAGAANETEGQRGGGGPGGPRGRGVGGWCAGSTSRSRPPAAWPSCAATSRPRAASSSSPATRSFTTRVPRACSTARRPP